jgi:CheY-like chemotaxis protein
MKISSPQMIPTAILIIEDDSDVLEVMKRALKRNGYDLVGVNDPKSALKILEEQPFDLIICDMSIPYMDGISFYHELEKHHQGLLKRILFTTGDPSSPKYQEFFSNTQTSVLEKPFGLLDLLSMVEAKLEEGKSGAS